MEKQQKEGTKKEEASKKNIQHIKINFHMFIVITIHTFKDKSMYGRATLVKQRPCFLTRRFLLHRCFFIFHFVSFLFFCTDTCTQMYSHIYISPVLSISTVYAAYRMASSREMERRERSCVLFVCLILSFHVMFLSNKTTQKKIVRMKMNKKKYKNIVCTSINGIFIQE